MGFSPSLFLFALGSESRLLSRRRNCDSRITGIEGANNRLLTC